MTECSQFLVYIVMLFRSILFLGLDNPNPEVRPFVSHAQTKILIAAFVRVILCFSSSKGRRGLTAFVNYDYIWPSLRN